MDQARILRFFKQCGVIERGHFTLASGRHTDRYINKDKLYSYPLILSEMCGELGVECWDRGLRPLVIVGPEKGGIYLAFEVTRTLCRLTSWPIRAAYLEKDRERGFVARRGFPEILEKASVLLVEDVLTTGSTTKESIACLSEYNVDILGVAALVNRGGLTAGSLGVPVLISLLDTSSSPEFDIPTWTKEECPLCKEGKKINTNVGHGAAPSLKKCA
jgi:orotate phosphoribosyltransferase